MRRPIPFATFFGFNPIEPWPDGNEWPRFTVMWSELNTGLPEESATESFRTAAELIGAVLQRYPGAVVDPTTSEDEVIRPNIVGGRVAVIYADTSAFNQELLEMAPQWGRSKVAFVEELFPERK